MTTPHESQNPAVEAPQDEGIVRLTFEVSQLRQEARHGWLRIGENPESVAEHTQRASVLGYLLAHREGYHDPDHVCTLIVFHDMHETRTGDHDLVQKKYNTADERRALEGQTEDLGTAGVKIQLMWDEVENGSTEAGIIAKDAEILEMCFTARELEYKGNNDAGLWIDNTEPRLKTESAKALLALLREADPNEWWKRICQ